MGGRRRRSLRLGVGGRRVARRALAALLARRALRRALRPAAAV